MAQTVLINAAATLLGVSRRTVYNYIKQGRLETVRTLNGSQRVTMESLTRASLVLESSAQDAIPDARRPHHARRNCVDA